MKKLGYARDYGEELSRAAIIVKQRTIFELNRADPEPPPSPQRGTNNHAHGHGRRSKAVDKSWMRKWRGSTEYMDVVKAFLIFSAVNSKTKGFIVCPCKKCCLGMTLREVVVYDHLTSGAGILEAGYTEWVVYTPDYLFLLQTILRSNPQGAVNFALMMSQIEGGCLVDYNTITYLFLHVQL
ncbi:uncharacterized protein LOC133876332 isoform X2 [Alnus glutinosa]|nr:uncharacterized protein LOC133876332 isoform X2 [Alnus glutinosa]